MKALPKPDHLRASLRPFLDGDPGPLSLSPIAGGDSHHAARAQGALGHWFIKWNSAGALPLFEEERDALRLIAKGDGPRVPQAIAVGQDDRHAWLILEYLDLVPHGDAATFGRQLVRLHRRGAAAHGFSADNYIGQTPQHNDWNSDWPAFWWQQRMQPQLERAITVGGHGSLTSLSPRLERASRRLLNHGPPPALLHGDLWGGNHAYLRDGSPVIFDPAASYGDRETDLAMMRLFGGFHPDVFDHYEAVWPLPDGHAQRRPLYQLYHVVNHLNLFGAGWLGRVERLADTVLSAAGNP